MYVKKRESSCYAICIIYMIESQEGAKNNSLSVDRTID